MGYFHSFLKRIAASTLWYRNIIELVDYQFVLPGEELARIQNFFLRQIPGPFELQGQLMRNPCIRSCLQWCLTQLLSSDSFCWMSTNEWLIRHPLITSLGALEMMDITEILLFCSLLEQWGNHRSEFRREILDKHIGLSAETILRKMSSLIMDEISSNEANDEVK